MRFVIAIAVAVTTLAVAGLTYAQSGAKPATPRKEAKAKLATIQVTPEREAAALAFVQRNHAELADLLAALKTNQPEEYERAIKDISRVVERLALIQERDPLQYELEVAAWTAQSRVDLLGAKLKMGTSDELIKQLREALATQNTAKAALLKHEHQKVSDRLSKLDSDIARFDGDRVELVNRQLKALTRAASEARPVKTAVKSSAKTKKSTTNSQ